MSKNMGMPAPTAADIAQMQQQAKANPNLLDQQAKVGSFALVLHSLCSSSFLLALCLALTLNCLALNCLSLFENR